jgi:hypothetical protein
MTNRRDDASSNDLRADLAAAPHFLATLTPVERAERANAVALTKAVTAARLHGTAWIRLERAADGTVVSTVLPAEAVVAAPVALVRRSV